MSKLPTLAATILAACQLVACGAPSRTSSSAVFLAEATDLPTVQSCRDSHLSEGFLTFGRVGNAMVSADRALEVFCTFDEADNLIAVFRQTRRADATHVFQSTVGTDARGRRHTLEIID